MLDLGESSIKYWFEDNKNLRDAYSVSNSDIAQHLKLPPVKLHCSMLAEDAIKGAIDDYNSKN